MDLLKRLYIVSSPSNDEKDMFNFIESWMLEHKFECKVYDWGITCVKGLSDTYPCIVAHMDEVHERHEGKRIFETENGILFGYDIAKGEQCGIGADDKNGIWVALNLLERLDAVKVAFFIGEEIGCVGSSQCDMGFFDDCRFVIQCDRRNGGDFITDAGVELCSRDFVTACRIKDFGYHEEHGLMTDVLELKERGLKVSACNVSCGYYRPHTSEEYTHLPELANCLAFVEWICRNLTEVYQHYAPPRRLSRYYGGYSWLGENRDDSWNDWYGWDEYGMKPDKNHWSVDDAKDFITNEICWCETLEEIPSADELFQWWRSYTNGNGIGKKKFRKAYEEVIEYLGYK